MLDERLRRDADNGSFTGMQAEDIDNCEATVEYAGLDCSPATFLAAGVQVHAWAGECGPGKPV